MKRRLRCTSRAHRCRHLGRDRRTGRHRKQNRRRPPELAHADVWTYEPPPTVPFAGYLTIDSALAALTSPLRALQRIARAACKLNFESDSQTLQFTLDPTHWFDQTNFAAFDVAPMDTSVYWVPAGVPFSSFGRTC